MKKYLGFWVIVGVLLFGGVVSADGVSVEFLVSNFSVQPEIVVSLERQGIARREQAMLFYLYGLAGQPLSERELNSLARRGWDYQEIAFSLGVPPVLFPDEVFTWRRPARMREFGRRGRWPEERVEQGRNYYHYRYEDRPSGIKEEIKIDSRSYKFEYKSRDEKEELKVDLVNHTYEYKYENRRSKEEIKQVGYVLPLTSVNVDRHFIPAITEQPGVRLRFNFNWQINF